jgi:hypothetical protein
MGANRAMFPIRLTLEISEPFSPRRYGRMVANGTKLGSPVSCAILNLSEPMLNMMFLNTSTRIRMAL